MFNNSVSLTTSEGWVGRQLIIHAELQWSLMQDMAHQAMHCPHNSENQGGGGGTKFCPTDGHSV